jgi:hypothetical protein
VRVGEALGYAVNERYLAECNDAMARMHGYERADDIVDLRFGDSRLASRPANTSSMRRLISSNYRLVDLQAEEFDAHGSIRQVRCD